MYKLENNVAWTEDLKNAFKHNVTRAKIVYTDYGDEITIDEDTGIKEIILDDTKYVPNVGFIGQATSRKVTLTLLDNEQYINLENKEFELYIGADYNNTTYYINYGKFIVNEPPENDSTNGTIKVIAYDYMIKFNKNYIDNIIYPCTLKDYLLNICNQAGVELGSQNFVNDEFTVVNNQFEGKQLREVLQHIGKCAFSWARIGQDNKLYFDFHVNDVNAITENITIDDYKRDAYKRANEYYGPVNRVTYAETDIQGEEESVSDQESISQYGENEIVIYDNYFAYTTSARHELIQRGTSLFGFKYMPISQLDLIGFVYLDCNDFVKVFDENENYIISRVFSHTIKYNGAVSDNIETEGQSNNESIYKNKNTTAQNSSRTEIIVDRANKKITQIVEDVTEQNTKIATLTQTVDDLTSQISDLADITTYGESSFASVSLDDVNTSEPIMLKVHPVSTNISYYYPNTSLYPDLSLFMSTRTVRFTRTYEVEGQELTENIDYELPDNLLYYDSEHYDEFYLDYESQTCQITKRCGYNADGTTYVLNNEVTTTYDYPLINLEEGDYTISLLGYEYGYIFVRLMAKNIYTTQFYTKIQTDSKIQQKADSINLSVNQKLTNYSTTSEMNSAIQLAKDSITSSVSETYITKQNSARNIDTAKQAAIDSANNSTDEKLEDYYTKTETNSQITQKANEITTSVSATYLTKSNASSTYLTQSNASSTYLTQSNASNTYLTKSNASSTYLNKQAAIDIYLSKTDAGSTYLTQSNASDTYATKAALTLKVDKELLISEINASADVIRLSSGRLIIDSGNFQLDADGKMACTDANISGTITGSTIIGSTLQITESSGTETYVGRGEMYVKGDGYKSRIDFQGIKCSYGNAKTIVSYNHIYITPNDTVPSGQIMPDDYVWIDKNGLTLNSKTNGYNISIQYNQIQLSKNNEGSIKISDSFITITDENGNYLNIAPNDFFSSAHGYPISVSQNGNKRGTILGSGINNFELKGTYTSNTYIQFQDDFFGTVYGISVWQSDRKYKENIQKTTANGIDMINKIPHYSFDWKADKKYVECGYIAQDMEQVNPDFVTKIEQGNGEYNYQINEQYIIPYITKALQEQYEENQKLKKDIEEIKQYLWREEGNIDE